MLFRQSANALSAVLLIVAGFPFSLAICFSLNLSHPILAAISIYFTCVVLIGSFWAIQKRKRTILIENTGSPVRASQAGRFYSLGIVLCLVACWLGVQVFEGRLGVNALPAVAAPIIIAVFLFSAARKKK